MARKEENTKFKLIHPKLDAAGWLKHDWQLEMEYSITAGRINWDGRTAKRSRPIYADYLQQHYPTAALKLTATLTEAFAALSRGEVALVLTDNLSAFEFLRSSAGRELDFIGPPLAIDETNEAAYIQVRKGDLALRDQVNAALRALWLDGTYHRINARYFPFSIY